MMMLMMLMLMMMLMMKLVLKLMLKLMRFQRQVRVVSQNLPRLEVKKRSRA